MTPKLTVALCLLSIGGTCFLAQSASAAEAVFHPSGSSYAPDRVLAQHPEEHHRHNRDHDRQQERRDHDDYRRGDSYRRDDYRRVGVRGQYNTGPIVIYGRDRDQDAYHRGEIYRNDPHRQVEYRRQEGIRVWIPGHWEPGFLGIGRRWVEGHWEVRN